MRFSKYITSSSLKTSAFTRGFNVQQVSWVLYRSKVQLSHFRTFILPLTISLVRSKAFMGPRLFQKCVYLYVPPFSTHLCVHKDFVNSKIIDTFFVLLNVHFHTFVILQDVLRSLDFRALKYFHIFCVSSKVDTFVRSPDAHAFRRRTYIHRTFVHFRGFK